MDDQTNQAALAAPDDDQADQPGQSEQGDQTSAPATPPPADSGNKSMAAAFDQYTQRQLQKQNSALQANIAAAAEKDPNVTAEAQRLGLQVGVGADVAQRNMALVRKMALVNDAGSQNLPQTAPRLANLLQDPNFSGVAYDDLDSLSRIEQGAAVMRATTENSSRLAGLTPTQRQAVIADRVRVATTPGGLLSEAGQGIANFNTAFFNAFKPFIDAAGDTVERALMSGPGLNEDTQPWMTPASELPLPVSRLTSPIQSWLSRPITQHGPQQYLTDPATQQPFQNPDYHWYGRNLANTVEQVPGTMAAMFAGGEIAGAGAEASGAEGAAEAVASKSVPAVLGTQAAQNTYAEARAKGADQKTAVAAALASGVFNYATMGELPGAAPAESVTGAIGQWATRSATMGTGMTVADNAIARSYDPNRSLTEGLGQSIATTAAFEGVGAMGHIIDAVQASKLRTRQPEAFQQFANAVFDGDPSVRIPAEDFVNYFTKQNIDPAVMANHLGATNLEEAAAAGSDLEVPKENFFGKLDPEHQKGLLPDVIDPATDMTARQAEAGRAELQDWIAGGGAEKLQAEYAQADAETQATPEWQSVHNELKQRYVDAGETDTAAENYATLQANALSYFAKNTGLKPDELLTLHNPNVTVGEAPGVAAPEVLRQGELSGLTGDEARAKLATHASDAIVPAPDGSLNYGRLSDDLAGTIGRPAGDIRLRVGSEAEKWGFAHILSQHGEQIEKKGFADPQEFLDHVTQNVDAIYPRPHDPNGLDLAVRSGRRGRMIVSLEYDADGHFYDVKTAHPTHEKLFANKTPLWERTGPSPSVGSEEPAPLRYPGAKAESSVAENGTELKPGEPLYQSGPSEDEESAAKDLDANDGTVPSYARSDGGEPIIKGPRTRRELNMESARVQGEMLKPAAGQEAAETSQRGWFRMLPDGRYEIGKTEIGDLSTFIHEPAHGYLESYRELTQRETASDRIKDDFGKITEWLGTTPEEAYKNGFTREQQEQWARGAEQYVREGKAPTSALRRVFQHFSVWLQSIYPRARALGVDMPDEVRSVMDRLYAGENAVNRAEQEAGERRLFEKPEDAGWTEAEYRNYADAHGIAVDEAKAQVLRELNEAAERERTEDRRDETRNVRDAVTQQVDARPEYTAIRSLRRGKLDDETPLTLNREALTDQFGEDRVKALQKLHPGLYRSEGGTDAETAAEIFGYHSGEEMMQAMEAAPRRSAAIEGATRDYLVNKYGDVRYDGSLNDRARFNLENNERAGNIYRELRALKTKVASLEKKASDAKAAVESIAPLEHYREAARQMVQQKDPADLQPNRYLDASRKYSREAFEALGKGNLRRSMEAKNKELLNHFLFREASEEREWATKFEKYAQKAAQSKGIQQRLGLAGSDYREQFNWLLARYKLGPQTAEPERSLRDWADDMYSQGKEPAIAPNILNEVRNADYRGVPMSELHDVHDALVNMRHLAQQEFKMFVQGKQVAFAEAKAAMMESARENLKVKPETVFDENRSLGDRLGAGVKYADALLVRMERMVEWLDGGKTGPWHDNLWNLAADAQGDEYTLQHSVTKAVTDALADMPDEMRRRLWTEKVNVEGISEPLPRRRMLSMAFNMGNEGNLDRLRKTFDSFGWDRGAIERIGGMLTHDEWQFVQKAWDSLKPLGERMVEMEKRLTGLPPAMVKVTPFKVALDDGTEMDLAGGYFPIVMDPRFSERAITQESKETAQNAMQSGYVRATTSKGYTKERTGFGGPLLLDYERALTSHVAKVTKDLSHREFMLSSQRLLLDTDVRKTLRETLGPAYERQFMPWLRTVINDRNGSVDQGLETVSNAMQTLRSNIVAASVGFKASTLMLQITHAPRMMLYAKPASLAQSLGDFLARPLEATREIRELSPNEMRFRGDSLDRDVRAVLQQPSYKSGYERKVAVAARFSLQTVDHLLSHTLWRAAYNDGLKKYADLSVAQAQKQAVYDADSAVRLGLNSQAPKDLPAIMRNNDFNKMITVLYGFHNGVYNQMRDSLHQFRYDRNVGKLTYAAVLTAILPAVVGSLVTGDQPKDGENPGLWAAQRALLFSADTVPVLSSVAEYMAKGRDMQFTPLESVMQQGAKAAMEAMPGKDEKDWLGIGLDAAGAAGELAGVPGSQQVVKTLRYMKRANEGKIENPSLWGAVVGGR